eukprot:gene395-428_t
MRNGVVLPDKADEKSDEDDSDLVLPPGSSIKQFIATELKHGKGYEAHDLSWGRKVIQAIDVDDCVNLGELVDSDYKPKVNINAQTTVLGYEGYLWTIRIHCFLGDTALHYAIRNRKLLSIYMLLFMKADVTMANQQGVTPQQLLLETYKTDSANMTYDAKRYIVNNIDPLSLKRLPRTFRCSRLEEEAWRLIHHGRLLYHELPQALQQVEVSPHIVSMKTRRRLSFNSVQSSVPYSPKSKSIKMKPSMSEVAAKIQAEAPWMEFELPKEQDEDQHLDPSQSSQNSLGQKHLGESSQEGEGSSLLEDESSSSVLPPGKPHLPRQFSLDSDEKLSEHDSIVLSDHHPVNADGDATHVWTKYTTDQGEDYYFNSATGETTWEVPQGYVAPSIDWDKLIESVLPANSIEPEGTAEVDDGSLQSSIEGKRLKPRPPLHLEDVWTKNSLQDIIHMVEKQKYNRIIREHGLENGRKPSELHGLSLLGSVKLGNQLEQVSGHETLLATGNRNALVALYREYTAKNKVGKEEGKNALEPKSLLQSKAKGLEKLKFISLESLEKTMQEIDELDTIPAHQGSRSDFENSRNSISRKHLVTSPHTISDRLLFGENTPSRRYNTKRTDQGPSESGRTSFPPASSRKTTTSSIPVFHEDGYVAPYIEALYSIQSRRLLPSSKSSAYLSQKSDSNLSSSKRSNRIDLRANLQNSGDGMLPRDNPAGMIVRTQSKQNVMANPKLSAKSPVFSPVSNSIKSSVASGTKQSSRKSQPFSHRDQHESEDEDDIWNKLYREVTELSTHTNLKYFPIGDYGAAMLSQALYDDPCIMKLTLSNAHITDSGCIALAEVLPTMKQLIYLDLSGNAIEDEGLYALADALKRSYHTANNSVLSSSHPHSYINATLATVTTLSVAGNRASLPALLNLLECVTMPIDRSIKNIFRRHKLYWLRNRGMKRRDLEAVAKYLEEHSFYPSTMLNAPQAERSSWEVYQQLGKNCIVMVHNLREEEAALYARIISLTDNRDGGSGDDSSIPQISGLDKLGKSSQWMRSFTRVGSQVSMLSSEHTEGRKDDSSTVNDEEVMSGDKQKIGSIVVF